MMDGPQEVAADTKEILDVHREKPLRVGSRFESAHLALPLPGRLVGDFGLQRSDSAPAYVSVAKLLDGITPKQAHAALKLRLQQTERMFDTTLTSRGKSK